MTQEASTEAVQMVLYDARGIQNMSSTDMSIMCSSGGSGNKMLRKVYDETNTFCDWIQRPSFYGRPAPFFDFERIRAAEEVELDTRVRAGASYGRSQLPRTLLQRALENDLWYEVPKGKFRREKGKGKGKKGKDGKKGERVETIGGMVKEPEPKGTGERQDKRVLPKGRKPNPTLSGGEGIEPYEIHSNVLAELRKLANQQVCTWYVSFDVCAFSR